MLPTRAPKLVLRAPAPHCCAHHPEAGRPAIPTEGKKLVPVQAPSLSLRAALSPSPSSEEQRDGDPHSARWGLRAEAGASTVTAPTPGKGRGQGKCSPSCSSLEAHNPGGSAPRKPHCWSHLLHAQGLGPARALDHPIRHPISQMGKRAQLAAGKARI